MHTLFTMGNYKYYLVSKSRKDFHDFQAVLTPVIHGNKEACVDFLKNLPFHQLFTF